MIAQDSICSRSFRRGERSGKDRMRIALIGQAAFGARVLEALIGDGHTVVVTYTSKDATQGNLVWIRHRV